MLEKPGDCRAFFSADPIFLFSYPRLSGIVSSILRHVKGSGPAFRRRSGIRHISRLRSRKQRFVFGDWLRGKMAGKTASIAKITRPVLAGHYSRKRLFRLIDRARKRPVLWICGPPGSGKTTLVSSYLAYRRVPGLWFRLEEGDADPATFFHYLGLAARKAAPRIRKPLPMQIGRAHV